MHIDTVFHWSPITAHRRRAGPVETLINAQMTMLNDSFAGRTAPDASDPRSAST